MQKSKQDYSNIDNKQRIIDTATKLFIKHGAHNTSLADIAIDLGISKGTLYYYYSSKSDLIFDVTDIYMKRLSSKLLNWIKGHDSRKQPAEIISVVFKTMFKTTSRGKLHIYLIYEAITHNDALKTRIKLAYSKWQEMLEEGLGKILSDKKDPAIIAEIILTMITGGVVHSALGIKMSPMNEVLPPIVD
ncbi:MAG: TetR/AcrR family transcriptional regulator [Spirochaetia bacterium]|jgi:AcrR family transcriptional regulator|nr:TetR/AcrR family transcriptional regulator [Spirochaetia bacterium]